MLFILNWLESTDFSRIINSFYLKLIRKCWIRLRSILNRCEFYIYRMDGSCIWRINHKKGHINVSSLFVSFSFFFFFLFFNKKGVSIVPGSVLVILQSIFLHMFYYFCSLCSNYVLGQSLVHFIWDVKTFRFAKNVQHWVCEMLLILGFCRSQIKTGLKYLKNMKKERKKSTHTHTHIG